MIFSWLPGAAVRAVLHVDVGRDFAFGAGGSPCFSEFVVFARAQGELHTVPGVRGACGAPIDPALKAPLHPDLGAAVVIGGGTGKYANGSGTFSDRVFVGFGAPTSGVGGIVYYDQLWFVISGKQGRAPPTPGARAAARARLERSFLFPPRVRRPFTPNAPAGTSVRAAGRAGAIRGRMRRPSSGRNR